MSEDSSAQSVDSHDKPVPSVEEDPLKSEQDDPVEQDSSIPSQSVQSNESPIILEKYEDTSPEEGIGDAFSKDHGDRFRSKVESRPLVESRLLAEGRLSNEKTNEVKSGK